MPQRVLRAPHPLQPSPHGSSIDAALADRRQQAVYSLSGCCGQLQQSEQRPPWLWRQQRQRSTRPTAEMAAIAALHTTCALAPWPFSSLDRAVVRGNSCTRARGPSGAPRDASIVRAAGIRNDGVARRRLLHYPRVERSQSEKREKSRSIRHREGEVCHVTTRPPLEHARKSPKSRASTGIRIARERAVSGSIS